MDIPLALSAIIAAVIIVTGFVIYNGIIGGHNRVQRAWADVLVYERQKTKILDQLQKVLADFMVFEASLLEKIAGLRSAVKSLPAGADGNALATVETATKALMGGLHIAFEAYPDLKASEAANNMMREIAEQQENVGAAITIYNRNVELFNNSIEMFPGSVINGLFNKKSPVTPFSDSEASQGFSYTPNL
ncbi:LemA family protein [Pseudomonas sp. FW215-R2]|uniref:LemA family protein n=1 Tax=Pseudomonas TaxID=286 RepID=UPI000C88879D|nr:MULTISPECIES: LemA family protein [Pseudomonas]PMX00712.1 LemA family protein [Pseudomonas sp. FW215-R2]PMX06547.1 LemA family protein [Pseudomonas sp. FW215-L1]PMX22609.1 LemA family protein [Pseudomonas sp. FW215-E1]PNA30398.1 LemA family protein [Pseudomonas sp. FW215-R4]